MPSGQRAIRFVLFDHLGTAKMLTSNEGIVEWPRYNGGPNELLPFGKDLVEDPTEGSYKLTFTNKELDRQFDLHYFGARYYDATLPRFVSPDPVSGKLEMPLSWNRYLYCRNDPVNYVEPDGKAPNKAGVTNPDQICKEIIADSNLAHLRDAHGGNENRYFYTDKYGWVDVQHFAETARMASSQPGWLIKTEGFVLEGLQWFTEWGDDYRSGFSPEDLPSNSAGIDFGSNYSGSDFAKWASASGAKALEDIPGIVNSLPSTDPSLKGGVNRGRSNFSSVPVLNRSETPMERENRPPVYY